MTTDLALNFIAGKVAEKCAEYGIKYPDRIEFSKRMTASSGLYVVDDKNPNGAIRLSERAFYQFGYKETLATAMHELAHHYLWQTTKDWSQTGHTDTFKKMCVLFGGNMNSQLAGNTYASHATEAFCETPFKWTYRCLCGGPWQHTKRKLSKKELDSYTMACPKCGRRRNEWKVEAYANPNRG